MLSSNPGIFYSHTSNYAAHVSNVVDGNFTSYPSDGLWRDYISSTTSTLTHYECGITCLIDLACGYFVVESGNCHVGNIGNVGSSLSPATDNQQVFKFIDFDRHASIVSSTFTDSTATFGLSEPHRGFLVEPGQA